MFFVFQVGRQVAKGPFDTAYENQLKTLGSAKKDNPDRVSAAFSAAATLSTAGPAHLAKAQTDIDAILKAAGAISDPGYKERLYAAALLAGEGSPAAALYVQKKLEERGAYDAALRRLKSEVAGQADPSADKTKQGADRTIQKTLSAKGITTVEEGSWGDKRLATATKWAYTTQMSATQKDVDDMLAYARAQTNENRQILYYAAALLAADEPSRMASDGVTPLSNYAFSQVSADGVDLYEKVNNFINNNHLRLTPFATPKTEDKPADAPLDAPLTGQPVTPSPKPRDLGDSGYAGTDVHGRLDWRPGFTDISNLIRRGHQSYEPKDIDLSSVMTNILDADWAEAEANQSGLFTRYGSWDSYFSAAKKGLSQLAGVMIMTQELHGSGTRPDSEFIQLMKATLTSAREFLSDTNYFGGNSEWFNGNSNARSLYDRAAKGDFDALVEFVTKYMNNDPTGMSGQLNPMSPTTLGGVPSITVASDRITRLGQFDFIVNMPGYTQGLQDGVNGARTFVPAYFDLNGEIYRRVRESKTFSMDDAGNVVTTVNDRQEDKPGIYTGRFATAIFFNGYGHFVRPGLTYSQIDESVGAELGIFKRDPATGLSPNPLEILRPQTNKGINLDYNLLMRAPSFQDRLITRTQLGLEGIESLFGSFNVFQLDMRLQSQFQPQEQPSHLLVLVPRFLIPLGAGAAEKGHYFSPTATAGYDLARGTVFIQPELRAAFGGVEVSTAAQFLYDSQKQDVDRSLWEWKASLRIDTDEFFKLFRSAGSAIGGSP